MFKQLRFVLAFCLVLCPAVAFSGDGEGLVEIEHVGNYGGPDKVFFFTSTHTGRPACNTHRGRWVLDLSTSMGKAQYSLLLAAQSSGKQVRVSGAHSCGLWSDTETVAVVGYVVNYGSHP